jgi:phage-related protein
MAENVVVNFTGNDNITPAAKKAEGAIKDVAGAAESVGSKFAGMKDIARGALESIGSGAIGLAGQIGSSVVGGVTDFFSSAVRGSMDYQNVLAQTQAVIESTGGAAGFTVEQMEEMARSMSAAEGMSLFADDEILKGQNILATFTKVAGDQFEGATQASLDMAQALGMDVSGAAMMMGKALNDPVKGIGALSRSGVSFTAEQKAMVESMVEMGDVAGAQNLILAEMETQFGGSALAATETFEGAMVLLKEGIEDAKGSIGDALLPVLTRLANVAMSTIVPAIAQITSAIGAWIDGLDWNAITTSISGVVNGFISFGNAIPWDAIKAGFDTVVAAIMTASPLFDSIKNLAVSLFSAFTGPDAQGAASGLAGVIGMIIGILGGLWSTIQSTLTAVINALSPIVAGIVEMAFRILGAITETLQSPELQNAFAQFQVLFATVGVVVKELADIISTVLGYALDGLRIAFDFLWPVIDFVFKQLMNAVSFVIPIVVGLLNSIIMVLKGDFAGAWNNIQLVISKAWTDIQTAVQKGIDAVKTKLTEWIDSASSFGSDLAAGIAKGITAGAGQIANAAKDAAMNALKAAKDFLGISSPSKMFADVIGEPISQGIAAGIAKGAPEINGALGMTLGGAAGGTQQTVQNYYLSATYNQRQSESSIMADLRAMQLLSGAV